MAKTKSTEGGILAIEARLLGYEKCGDHSRLAAIAEHLGFPVDTLLKFLRDKDADEDFLKEISEAIDKTATHSSADSKGTTIIADLKAVGRTGFKFETTDCLPTEVFNELAQLTSAYSVHRKTKTVVFSGERLVVDRKAAFSDSSKDTYIDNGEVAKNFVALINGITGNAEKYQSSPTVFRILGRLYNTLTSLSDDACNQANAAIFAEVLQEHTPRPHKTSWKDKIASEFDGTRSR